MKTPYIETVMTIRIPIEDAEREGITKAYLREQFEELGKSIHTEGEMLHAEFAVTIEEVTT